MSDWTDTALIVGGRILVSILFLQQRRRATSMRGLAIRLGFYYLGSALPRSFSAAGTPLTEITSVWNAIDGECAGIRVLAFDCRIGEGKRTRRRTVIAAKTNNDVFGLVGLTRNLTTDRSGDWIFLYEPWSFSSFSPDLMSMPELEAHLTAISLPIKLSC
jgi:hypothetical protein